MFGKRVTYLIACVLMLTICSVCWAAPLDDLQIEPQPPVPPSRQPDRSPSNRTDNRNDHSRAAAEAFRKGDVDDCLRHLRSAVAETPSLPPPRLILAGMYLSVGGTDKASALLEEIAAEGSQHPTLYLTFADLALAQNRLMDAWVHVDHAQAAKAPASWTESERMWLADSALSRRIIVVERRGNWHEAVQYLSQLVNARPDEAGLRRRWGRALYQSGNERKAFEQFDIAFKQQKSLGPPEVAIGSLLVEQGKLSEAVQWYEKAAAAHPSDGSVHVAWSMALLYQGEADDAEEHARRARAKGVDTPGLDLQLGIIARQQRQYAEAEVFLNKVLKLVPLHPEATYHLVLSLIAHRNDAARNRALEVARASFEAYPNSALTLAALGAALHAVGNVEEAEQRLRASVTKKEVQPECVYLLGRLLSSTDRDREAKEVARRLETMLNQTTVFVTRESAKSWVAEILR